MDDWWGSELERHRRATSTRTQKEAGEASSSGKRRTEREGDKDVTRRGEGEQSGDQWGGTLPGHGGT